MRLHILQENEANKKVNELNKEDHVESWMFRKNGTTRPEEDGGWKDLGRSSKSVCSRDGTQIRFRRGSKPRRIEIKATRKIYASHPRHP